MLSFKLKKQTSKNKAGTIFKKQYENYPNKKLSTEDISKMADFVLQKNLFEFDSKFYKQITGMAIGTKFAPPMFVFSWTRLKRNF